MLILRINSEYIAGILLVWFLLFIGGCMVPNLTGMIVSSFSAEEAPLTSCVSSFINNLGGFFLCPLLSGWIMD